METKHFDLVLEVGGMTYKAKDRYSRSMDLIGYDVYSESDQHLDYVSFGEGWSGDAADAINRTACRIEAKAAELIRKNIIKHTTGPWSTYQDPDGSGKTYGIETINSRGVTQGICVIIDNRGSEETEANARLIAAAPELLRALERAVAHSDFRLLYSNDAQEQMHAAIAKATGNEIAG